MSEPYHVTFDDALPIAAAVDQIRTALLAHQVIIVAGETGSGKTTQLPKICLLAGKTKIGHTQPRRIAARSVAERIAFELGVELGDTVGYQVRFTKKVSQQTTIKLMTDGILLAEISHDRDLRDYDTIIIDEAHERSLNIDFLLGYLKQLLPRRPDLSVIVTSATIDTARFASHFDDAPVIEVSGRTYPVDIVYDPPQPTQDDIEPICEAVSTLHGIGGGDILVFLSGEREIRDTAAAITALKLRDLEVLPLYARLSSAEQNRVFQPHRGTRVVLATNVAETSLTVPGIRFVVDPGFARISRYSVRTKVQRLPIEQVSQASANQRAGRCGRLGPGVAIRLYSQDDFEARPEFTEPEILRTNLASVILQMMDARLGRIEDFPFVEAPDQRQVRDGVRLLEELGAIETQGAQPRLTKTGRLLARLPVDPRLGRMLVEGSRLGVLSDLLPIVAALAIPDVRERPAEHQQAADTLHRRFQTPFGEADARRDPSDVMSIYRLWNYLRTQQKVMSGNAFRRMCRQEYLNFLRIREWQDLVSQLRQIVRELGMSNGHRPDSKTVDVDGVSTAVLAGLLSHVGLKDSPSGKGKGRRNITEYLGARGTRFSIQPGSAAAKAEPELVMAVELVETTRLWARTVAPIRVEWIEQVGAHLLKRQYSEPRWSAAGGQCVASEKVTLLGVPIVAGRIVSYQRIDPVVSRQLFIQSALVEGQWRTRHRFFARNEQLRTRAEELEERTRRRDLVVTDATIFAFYDERIPSKVTSVAHFDRWWRDTRRTEPHLLDLNLDDLMAEDAAPPEQGQFPDMWVFGEHSLPVSYTFSPGSGHDGVSVDVDVSVLNQVDAAPFTWQVPGLRTELGSELIRRLPKAVRTRYVPAPDWAGRALVWLDEHPQSQGTPFPKAFATALTALGGEPLTAEQFDTDALPDHLHVRYVITDGDSELGAGKNFDELKREFAPALSERLNTDANLTHEGARDWQFGALPEQTEITASGRTLVGYPALVDQGDSVGVHIHANEASARRSHALGIRRLLTLVSPDPTRWVFAHLSNEARLALGSSPYPSLPALLADARLRATGDLIAKAVPDPSVVRDAVVFGSLVNQVRPDAADTMDRVVERAARILARYHRVRRFLDDAPQNPSRDDVAAQLENLIFPGFIAAIAEPHYGRLETYLHAVELRMLAWASHPAREASGLALITELEDAFDAATSRYEIGSLPAQADAVGWLLEELRVSLFAQQLGTSQPVSAKRLRAAIATLP